MINRFDPEFFPNVESFSKDLDISPDIRDLLVAYTLDMSPLPPEIEAQMDNNLAWQELVEFIFLSKMEVLKDSFYLQLAQECEGVEGLAQPKSPVVVGGTFYFPVDEVPYHKDVDPDFDIYYYEFETAQLLKDEFEKYFTVLDEEDLQELDEDELDEEDQG